MDAEKISAALTDITAESDPTLKALRMASLCSALFRERDIELVVVGGSAIELLTDGAYASGDLDFCLVSPPTIPLRLRQELMGQLGAMGGPRNWQTAGLFIDLLGPVESYARTEFRKLQGPYGMILLMKPEDLFVERVLVSVYPQPDEPARQCARMLAAVALRGQMEMEWNEVKRLAALPEYRIVAECEKLLNEVADELKRVNPLHPTV